jgi:hypothetical protein
MTSKSRGKFVSAASSLSAGLILQRITADVGAFAVRPLPVRLATAVADGGRGGRRADEAKRGAASSAKPMKRNALIAFVNGADEADANFRGFFQECRP